MDCDRKNIKLLGSHRPGGNRWYSSLSSGLSHTAIWIVINRKWEYNENNIKMDALEVSGFLEVSNFIFLVIVEKMGVPIGNYVFITGIDAIYIIYYKQINWPELSDEISNFHGNLNISEFPRFTNFLAY